MGIPGFPFLSDFRDPVVIIGISLARKRLMIQMMYTLLADTVRFENKYKVANSGGRDPIPGQMEGSC